MNLSAIATGGRIDWKTERDRIDLATVATDLLGPAPGRQGEKGRRLWWPCPFHDDRNPSFYVVPGEPWWKCLGCGERGDAANLLMRLERVGFPDAMRRLTGGDLGSSTYTPSRRPIALPLAPKGLPVAEAMALVTEAQSKLWSDEGSEARYYLTQIRRLDPETIRSARLGWISGVKLPTQDGRTFTAQGILIPWFADNRLTLAKIRQPEGRKPKYAEAFRDRPGFLLGTPIGTPGSPLVVVEGEFDSILLGQELHGLATVATLGPASVRPDPITLIRFLSLSPWMIATDADEAGDRAAAGWPARSVRVRPPRPFNDWTEAVQGGVNLRRWWIDRLASNHEPPLFAWTELAAHRWGPTPDSDPGVILDHLNSACPHLSLESLGLGPGDAYEPSEVTP